MDSSFSCEGDGYVETVIEEDNLNTNVSKILD